MTYYQTTKKDIDKRSAQILHSIKRARERYGLELSIADIESIAQLIRAQKTRRVKDVSNTRVIHELDFNGITVLVVYDKKRHTLNTFLPKD
jgi:hypothetical protein